MKTVLIADDHSHVRTALRNLFSAQPDISVCGEAANGDEAVARAIDLRPDLIVLDMSMPVLNGLEATQMLRKTMPNVPIVLFTGHRTKFSDAYAAAAGVTSVVGKDQDIKVLVDEARHLLRLC
jgi:NarL family two-component system response regulator LiaR